MLPILVQVFLIHSTRPGDERHHPRVIATPPKASDRGMKTLLDKGVHTSGATVRDILKTHQICTVVLPTDDGSSLRIRKAATPDPDVQQFYRHLDISPDIIKPRHTWAKSNSD